MTQRHDRIRAMMTRLYEAGDAGVQHPRDLLDSELEEYAWVLGVNLDAPPVPIEDVTLTEVTGTLLKSKPKAKTLGETLGPLFVAECNDAGDDMLRDCPADCVVGDDCTKVWHAAMAFAACVRADQSFAAIAAVDAAFAQCRIYLHG